MNKNRKTNVVFAYSTIGIQLALTLLIFVYIGFKLDSYYNTSPLFVALSTIVGMIAGFYNLFRGIRGIEEVEKKNKKDNKTERKKWL